MTDVLTPEQRSYCMSQIRAKDMQPEMAVRSMIHRLGFRFRLHQKNLPGNPDIVLAKHRAAIFVHGCFWHWHPDPKCPIARLPESNVEYWGPKLARTRERDAEHLAELSRLGWRVLVIWECDLQSPESLVNRICSHLKLDRAAQGTDPGTEAGRQDANQQITDVSRGANS
ncbi:MAG: DNA mismatch endonuclease Vsr [Chloroflexi bacterium]|nr:DNA mismatch endonuclease Vsr [Chloroflexota bacterium]